MLSVLSPRSTATRSPAGGRARRLCWVWLLFGMSMCSTLSLRSVLAANEVVPEPELKAALLVKLLRFVIWPESAFPATNAPLRIGVLNPNPFGTFLERAVAGKEIDGHRLEVRYAAGPGELTECQVVFMTRQRRQVPTDAIRSADRRPVLLVGEEDGFVAAANGGMINLLTRNEKPYLQINARAAERAGLKFRGQLAQTRNIEWVERPSTETR